MTNGFEAIDFVKENNVDVVLLDETMHSITGLETLQKIKGKTAGTGGDDYQNETENLWMMPSAMR